MICPQCGTNVPDNARFCPKCGNSFAAAATPPPDQQPTVPSAPAPAVAPQAAPGAPQYAAQYVAPTVAMPPVAPPPYPPAALPYAAQPAPGPHAFTLFASYPAAGLGGRFGAYLLDAIVASLLIMPAAAMAGALFFRSAGNPSTVAGSVALVLYALGGLWALVYYIVKDGLKGASFGRRIAGETVVSLKTGGPATVGQSFMRNLILWLLGIIDAIVLLVDKEHRRLGDKAASTQVVPTKDYVAMTAGAYVPPGKGLAIAMVILPFVLLVVGGVLGFVLGGMTPSTASTTSSTATKPTTTTPTKSATSASADSVAVETAVKEFYDNINGGDLEKVKSLVTDDTKSAIDPSAFEGWTTTSFEFARSVIDANTAYVYGRENPRRFGGETGGVKFTLDKVGGSWLIQTWNAVDEATVNGVQASSGQGTGAKTLDEASARDIVNKLLQARQKGDANAVRSLTTASFQTVNADVWFDGIPVAEYMPTYKILSAAQSGSSWIVKTSEDWNSGTEVGTYTVIEQNATILVDSWDSASQ